MDRSVSCWYIVSVHSGFENKVAQDIRDSVQKKGLQHCIDDILIPTESVVEIKNRAKVSTEKKIFPGYVLIKMLLTDDVWHLIGGMPKVSGFLGGKERPSQMAQVEVDAILAQMQERRGCSQVPILYEIGDRVSISDGPFVSFQGLVEEVDLEKGRLKVSISIFGRATPVDLEFSQVEKA